ncbi:MAG: hypothetical protein RMK29_07575 [Myxococcales bacterium]|nr:hypothetical protein [Myxococcota bacterium]MDW8281554.1 hypothetical protein [Myxococcales bacterium]
MLNSLLLKCGTAMDTEWAGRVGNTLADVARIEGIFQGRGSMREKLSHVTNFVANILLEDIIPEGGLDRIKHIARQAGLNMQRLRAREKQIQHERAKRQKDAETTGGAAKPIDGDTAAKLGYKRVSEMKDSMRKKAPDQSQRWSRTTKAEFEAQGGVLSAEEKASTVNPFGAEFLPWSEGERTWLIDYSSKIAQRAHKLNIPLVAGVSGTTAQIMDAAKFLNCRDIYNVRLAVLGYLIPVRAHSFHEIMLAARHFGCAYGGKGDYTDIKPLTSAEIDELKPPKPAAARTQRTRTTPSL